MKKSFKKIAASILALAMILGTVLSWLPSWDVLAAPETMGYLKAGSGNGNGHFGGEKPEAFVLSTQTVGDEDLGFTMKMGSAKAETRFRFVTKYVDDSHWGYIAYDGANSHWFYEFRNGDASSYPTLSGLPEINEDDEVEITASYEADGLHVAVENRTTGKDGQAVASDSHFADLGSQRGQIGFGAANYSNQLTEIYFSDVTIDGQIMDYSQWSLYKEDLEGQIWNPAMEVGGEDDPKEGRAWINIHSNSQGGHNYSGNGPALLLDQDKVMEKGGSVSLAVKPGTNWGVFYTYVDDNNWLYVGKDPTSGWYFQYNLNGAGGYPAISGLPETAAGEELAMSIALNNETLEVTVNGTTARVTNQTLIDFMEQNAGKGKFGVKTNDGTISFADFTCNDQSCMEDTWAFCSSRGGQSFDITYTAMRDVSGSVKDEEGKPVEGATVRFGTNSTVSQADGSYKFEDKLQIGAYNMAVTKPGYQAYEREIEVTEDGENVFDAVLTPKPELDLTQYDSIQSDEMKVYIGKEFPVVARYQMLADGQEAEGLFFRGNETPLNELEINGTAIQPVVTVSETTADSRTYDLHVENTEASINLDMSVRISVKENDLTWEVTGIKKADGCAKIATIDIPQLNLLSVDAADANAQFDGAKASTTTTSPADYHITFSEGFAPSESDGYLYGFLSTDRLSAGLFSNSEIEGDKRVERNNGADTMSLTSAAWYYEAGDKNGQANGGDFPVSELPCAKVAIGGDLNEDGTIDWNDGALAYRDIMHVAYGSDTIKDAVNYRIVMNFASMAPNPYLETADNIKKVFLATDGLPQAVMLKGYGNEGHDSANSEYADIAEREGGVEDFQELIRIAHDYNTEIGIHVNAQEAYPEAKSFNEDMLQKPYGNGWGWLDQSVIIDKHWDLASQARWKRFVQLYDRINGTSHYSGSWEDGEYVKDSQGDVDISKEELQKEAESLKDNMDFIYLDVWYQDAWETRQIAKEINSLGWRFSTEFSAEGEYDSTWQHWSTDASYGGASAKGYNSEIIRFIRNDQRDSQVLNYPGFGGTADNPLLGGYRLYGFEGWGGDQDFNNYILQTFDQNLPTRFLQHYNVVDWEDYEEGTSPVGNREKQITLKEITEDDTAFADRDTVVVTRNEGQRSDERIERTITLNGKVVLNTDTENSTYLLPWTDNQDGSEKLYHWNVNGGSTTWQLQDDWAGLANVVVYELSDQGRVNERTVPVNGGQLTLDNVKAQTAYVVVKGAAAKTLKADFGESDYVVDPGFNGYAGAGESLSGQEWSGDIANSAVTVQKDATGDQTLVFDSPLTDVSVSTAIAGLDPEKQYVAEIYVDNASDAKAWIKVNTGSSEVSSYTIRSIAANYVKCDEEHTGNAASNMQRIQISFTPESESAVLTLAREAGSGATYMDDIRIVEKTLTNYQEDGSFEQDFESVVQGLYPFVLGPAQGVNDPVTHLSQKNAPYTQKGWNGRVIDDVIDCEWSLKHHGANTGIIYQTIPQNFRFEPGKTYKVEFDYQAGPSAYAMVVGDGTTYNMPSEYLSASDKTQHVEMTVVGSGSGQTWIGLYENGGQAGSGAMGQTDFVLDNLKITEDTSADTVVLETETPMLGDTVEIYGNTDNIASVETTDQSVVKVAENNTLQALKAGNVTITVNFKSGESQTFEVQVSDKEVTEIPREGMSAATNMAQPDYGGANVLDGSSSSNWDAPWNKNVSETDPAIIQIDLGQEMTIYGFKFQQRSGQQNGVIQQYRYRTEGELDPLPLGEALSEDDGWSVSVEVDDAGKQPGAWVTCLFDEPVTTRFIQMAAEKGSSNDGKQSLVSMAEFVALSARTVTAEGITVNEETVKAGESKALTVNVPEGIIAPEITWTSDNEEVVKVTSSGVITGVSAGTANIVGTTIYDDTKLTAAITVEEADPSELESLISQAEAVEKELNSYWNGSAKDAFNTALANARAAAESGDQDKIQEAITGLKNALAAMEGEKMDKTPLETAIQSAKEIDQSQYPDGTEKDNLNAAIAQAEKMMEEVISETEMNQMIEELRASAEALKNAGEKPDPDKDDQAPTQPQDLKASKVKETSFEISWKASEDNVGVKGYEIRINGEKIGTVGTTAALIDNLKPGTEYRAEVRAFDEAGNYSVPASVTVKTEGKMTGGQGSGTDGSGTSAPSGKPGVTPVRTGDAAPVIALVVVMAAAAGAAGTIVYRKTRKRRA